MNATLTATIAAIVIKIDASGQVGMSVVYKENPHMGVFMLFRLEVITHNIE